MSSRLPPYSLEQAEDEMDQGYEKGSANVTHHSGLTVLGYQLWKVFEFEQEITVHQGYESDPANVNDRSCALVLGVNYILPLRFI